MTMTAEQRRRRHDVIARMAAEEDDYPPGGIVARTGDDLTAAGWEPEEHPRGNDGRFIEAGAVVDLLKKATKDLTTNDVNTAVKSLDKKTWDHLKPEQKKHITDAAGKLPTGSDIGAKLTQLEGGKLAAAPKIDKAAPAGKPVTPAIIYKKNPDGFVVAESPDGKKRMRWDAASKKFVVEDENGKQLDSLNKTSAYAAVKDSKRWVEPGQADATLVQEEPAEVDVPEVTPANADEVTPPVVDAEHSSIVEGPTKSYRARMMHKVTDIDRELAALLNSGKKLKNDAGDQGLLLGAIANFTGANYPTKPKKFQNGTWFWDSWNLGIAEPELLGDSTAHRLIRAVAAAPPVKKPLYRGVFDIDDETLASWDVGHEFNVDRPSSFTSDENVARGFAWGTGSAGASVLFEVKPGSHMLSIERNAGSFAGQREYLGMGRFRVVDRKTTEVEGGAKAFHITLEEVDENGQTGTKTEPPEPPQTPEPEAPVVEPAPKPDVAPAAESITPETTPQPEAPNAPTPPYEGPKVDLDQYISKDVQDEVRQLFLEDMMYRLKVDELTGELHKKFPEKYGTGYTGWSDARKDAETQVEAPNNPTTESILEKAFPGYGDNYTVRQNIRSRLHNEAQVEASLSRFARHNNLELTDELKADLARRTREAFAGKKIAVRVTPRNLEHILNSGRIKSQFETGKSKGKKDVDMRASVEKTLFGITDKPHQNVEKRPIYGYVALDGVRPVGEGSGSLGGVSTDALSQYGNVQVILKDDVRRRTTAMFGDSLNNMHEGMPSPVDDPSWLSFTASRGGLTGHGLQNLERGGDMPGFRANSYAEAEIHGGVSVDDIDEVVLPSASAALQKALDARGIRWRVLNWKNALKVTESPEEREIFAKMADEDVRAIDEKIAWYHKTWPGDKLTSDLKKEIEKYEKLRAEAVKTADALRAASKKVTK